MKYNVYIAVDPGIKGGISILDENNNLSVYSTPVLTNRVEKTKAGKKKVSYKSEFNLRGMRDILFKYQDKKVLFCIEAVGVRPHDAKNSMFSFGEGVGYWKGMAVALGADLCQVFPQTWKKSFSQLETVEISTLREETKVINQRVKEINNKIKLEGKKLSKEDKDKLSDEKKLKLKEIEALNRRIKENAKGAARFLASDLFESQKDEFKLKKDDGKAESVLMALWCKKTTEDGEIEKYKLQVGPD